MGATTVKARVNDSQLLCGMSTRELMVEVGDSHFKTGVVGNAINTDKHQGPPQGGY